LTDAAERAAWIRDLVVLFEHVNGEDRHVVEGIYAGSGSSFASPGQLSWLEREIHDFQKYLAQRLAPDTKRG
jgi:choline monooxygenase